MQDLWTKEELEVYIKYCKLNNLKYESIWINMDDEEREKALLIQHNQMCKIDKPVKVYLDFEYIDTVRYSLVGFIKEEIPNKLLTWIPDHFESKQEAVSFLDKHIQFELKCN